MAKTRYNELDYTYAVARLRALETHLIGTGELEKLLNASTADDAAKSLVSLGWKNGRDFEEMLYYELEGVFSLLESLGGGDFLKTQRVKYDYHNLKVLIKSELTKQDGDEILVDFGNIKASVMKSAVINRDYRELTEAMAEAIPLAYERYSRVADAQLVDIILDSALFKDMWDYAQSQPEGKILSLIKMQIDMYNIKTFVRVRKMGKTHGFIETVIAEGGDIPPGFYISRVNASMESDGGVFEKTPYAKAFQGENLELELDNMFMEKVKGARLGAFGLAPLAAYFWMKENEIRNVRIILTCKNAGIDEDVIRKRLRG